MSIDIEDIQKDEKSLNIYKCMVHDLLKMDEDKYNDNAKMAKTMLNLNRKYKIQPTKRTLGIVFRQMIKQESLSYPQSLYTLLIKNSIRSDSGILNISVSMPPDKFSCKYNCFFCPNEPGMPRSYLSNEDVFVRALESEFDCVKQVQKRLEVLEINGHPIDKVEFRVLGGTFSCYSHEIADQFVRDLYYAANTYFSDRGRKKLSIEEEQALNVTSKVHVVGLGIETRPDEIDEEEIIRFRKYGVTRVELGIQHTNDDILKKVNRGHTLKHSKRAIKLLKDYGFKIEIHVMADLPFSSPEEDMICYSKILRDDPDLFPDYMKDYPCLDVSFTKIREWKKEGKWRPYSERTPDAKDLVDVLVYRQKITPKWVRVNRIQRDFKTIGNCGLGYESESIKPNLSQYVHEKAEKEGIYCKCIRCCEVRNENFKVTDIVYKVEKFEASSGTEYFISAEIDRPKRHLLLGFLRLRLSKALENSVIPELKGKTAMIRELHVYGRVSCVGNAKNTGSAQHLGIGKKLLAMAEKISTSKRYEKIAVISGIGVRDYYRKRGYELDGTYMLKKLDIFDMKILRIIFLFVILALLAKII